MAEAGIMMKIAHSATAEIQMGTIAITAMMTFKHIVKGRAA